MVRRRNYQVRLDVGGSRNRNRGCKDSSLVILEGRAVILTDPMLRLAPFHEPISNTETNPEAALTSVLVFILENISVRHSQRRQRCAVNPIAHSDKTLAVAQRFVPQPAITLILTGK